MIWTAAVFALALGGTAGPAKPKGPSDSTTSTYTVEYKNAYKSKSIQRSAIVRITATGGAIGLGNIDPSPGYSKESIEDTSGRIA